MASTTLPRRSIWTWGLEADEPTDAQRAEYAKRLSEKLGVSLAPLPIPRARDLRLRPPRIAPPASIAGFCFTDNHERAAHSYGADKERAVFGEFPNPPDVVAYPSNDSGAGSLPRVVLKRRLRHHTLRRRLLRRRGRHAAGGLRRYRHHRHEPVRQSAGDRRRFQGGAHTGRRIRPRAGKPAPTRRLHAAPLPAEFHRLHPGRLDRHAVRGPLRHQSHPHRRLRGVGADAHAVRLVGVPPAARKRRGTQAPTGSR